MSLDPNTWFEQARARVDAVRLRPEFDEIGRVRSVGDGIALIAGLPRVRLNELLRFDKGQFGIAHTLDRDTIGCVLLDEGRDDRGRRYRARHRRGGAGAGRTSVARPCRRSVGTRAG